MVDKNKTPESPLLSIIIPVYNVEMYLRRCIESVLAQSFANWEMILIDDGSSDGSGSICDDYAVSDNRIQVVHTPNGGQSKARNIGLENVHGNYITFVDSDDYLINEDFFAKGLDAVLRDDKIDIIVFSWERRNLSGQTVGKHYCKNIQYISSYEYFFNYQPINGDSAYCYYVPVWAKIYRRELFQDIKFKEGMVFEDVAINSDLFLKARKICLSPDVCYAYSENHTSTMAHMDFKKSNDGIMANLYVLSNLMKIASIDSLPSFYLGKIFYESCCVALVKGKLLSDEAYSRMDEAFSLLRIKKKIPYLSRQLMQVLGAKKACKMYVGLMKIRNRK